MFGINEKQFVQMLKNLPASCAYDAVENIEPPVSANVARFVLLNAQTEGLVLWSQEQGQQKIELTEAGRNAIAGL